MSRSHDRPKKKRLLFHIFLFAADNNPKSNKPSPYQYENVPKNAPKSKDSFHNPNTYFIINYKFIHLRVEFYCSLEIIWTSHSHTPITTVWAACEGGFNDFPRHPVIPIINLLQVGSMFNPRQRQYQQQS